MITLFEKVVRRKVTNFYTVKVVSYHFNVSRETTFALPGASRSVYKNLLERNTERVITNPANEFMVNFVVFQTARPQLVFFQPQERKSKSTSKHKRKNASRKTSRKTSY